MSIKEKAWEIYCSNPDFVAMSKRAFAEVINAYEAAKAPEQPVDLTCLIRDALSAWLDNMGIKISGRYNEESTSRDFLAQNIAHVVRPHIASTKRESSGVHGYEISGNTIYIGPMREDRVKVAEITCTIDWDETYTEESKAQRIRDAERICRGLDRE